MKNELDSEEQQERPEPRLHELTEEQWLQREYVVHGGRYPGESYPAGTGEYVVLG